ncbi:MAG: hypothetical protein M3Q19_12775 [Pseudomonadota bacterium]|nr:hypothetical protein [Pseudomonadota bacterium]
MNRSAGRVAGAGDQLREIVDFNIHDLVGIRLVDPSSRDVAVVAGHLGLKPSEFSGSPALTITYVDRLTVDQPLRFLGRDDVAFTDDAFIIVRSRTLARARTKVAMDRIGETCELVCETGLPAIPLLRQLLNLVMLARNVVPVHAAAFNHQDRGVLVTGWSHGSKTGTLLAFMAAGAKFIGDEWLYLSASHDRMYGLPDQLEARPWYLDELPQYQRQVRFLDRARTGLTAGMAGLLSSLAARSEQRNSLAAKLIRYAHQALLDQQSIHLKPLSLFGAESCSLASPLDVVIVAASHDSSDVLVSPAQLEQVAGRMAASFVHEQASLLSCYHKHLFAFPDRRNSLLDQLEQIYRERVGQALRGKPAYTMLHPYPVGIQALRQAIEPLLTTD